MVRIDLTDIRHDYGGFGKLVELNAKVEDCVFEKIEIDMRHVRWFDADMAAPFGAILYRLSSLLNNVRLTNFRTGVEEILSKNAFLSNYGRKRIPDRWGTTIPYERFEAKDGRYFGSYIEGEFIHRTEMPKMSKGLTKKFRESVFEIFSNAVIHSQTELGIFSCGQYFPKRNRLDFSVADLGIGIRRNVKKYAGLDLKADAAVQWATEGNNTTKRGPIPGGLGLKLLREFIELNQGRLQIVSDAGFWCCEEGRVYAKPLQAAFPGTCVVLEINTADTSSYLLKSELSESDIF